MTRSKLLYVHSRWHSRFETFCLQGKMSNREEEFANFKEHLKKNVYDVTWSAFTRRDQSFLSQNERKVIFDKFVKALLILQSMTIDTPNTFVQFVEVMDELRVHIQALD